MLVKGVIFHQIYEIYIDRASQLSLLLFPTNLDRLSAKNYLAFESNKMKCLQSGDKSVFDCDRISLTKCFLHKALINFISNFNLDTNSTKNYDHK